MSGPVVDLDVILPATMDMDTSSAIPKRSRSCSPAHGGSLSPASKTTKAVHSTYASVLTSPPPPVPPRSPTHAQPLLHDAPPSVPSAHPRIIIMRSVEGSRCFIHPGKVATALYKSIFQKKLIGNSLSITGGGRGIKFDVANLDGLSQAPESVTRLGEWPVKCWVASQDDPTYLFGRIYPVGPDVTMTEIMDSLTVLEGEPSTLVDAFRLPNRTRGEETVPNLAIRLKFRGPLPTRVAIQSFSYRVLPHTLPVPRCTRCLLFGHGNVSCNGKVRCGRCSGFHPADACERPESCLFCGADHRPTSRQCPAYLQAVKIQELQHHTSHSITDIKRLLRGIRPGAFRPKVPLTSNPPAPCPATLRPPPPSPATQPPPPKPLSPIISVVPPAAGPVNPIPPLPPSPKHQRERRSPKRLTKPKLEVYRLPCPQLQRPAPQPTQAPPSLSQPQPHPSPSPRPTPQRPVQPPAQQPLPPLGSAPSGPSQAPPSVQHAADPSISAFIKGVTPVALNFVNLLLSGCSLRECLVQCLPGLVTFLTSLIQ